MRRRRSWAAMAAAVLALGCMGAALAKPGKGHAPKPKQVVVNGVVKGAPAGDPIAFVVHRRGHGKAGANVSVVTSAATTYKKSDGSAATAADVVDGAKVQVKGVKSGGGLAARQVMVKVPDAGDGSGTGDN